MSAAAIKSRHAAANALNAMRFWIVGAQERTRTSTAFTTGT